MNQARARKLGDRIAQIVAEMLERRIKDPRLGFVTVTEARVTGDLREATVFYTVYGSDDEVAGTRAALASATGLIRSEVGRQTGLKHTPSISFSQDTIPDTARTIEDLVAKARAADAAVAAARADAVPAGDPDPYRTPRPMTRTTSRGRRRRTTLDDDDASDDERTGPGRAPSRSSTARARVCLACHVRPDADALGSMLAVAARAARRPGRRTGRRRVVRRRPVRGAGDPAVPARPRAAEPAGRLSGPAARSCCRSTPPAPTGWALLAGPPRPAAELIVLDHHASNTGFGTINLVDPAAAATAVLAAELIDRLGVPLTRADRARPVRGPGHRHRLVQVLRYHAAGARASRAAAGDRHRPRRRVPRTLRPRPLQLPRPARRRARPRHPRAARQPAASAWSGPP